MSEVLKEEYAAVEMQTIARLAKKSVSELSQTGAAELHDLYDIPEVSRAYDFADFKRILSSFQFYRQPRQ